MSADPDLDEARVRRMLRTGDVEGLVKHFEGFARYIAIDYFIAGADRNDVIQEARVGLLKAVRDFRGDRSSSFRNFAELCIRRQVITAVKTATRLKHKPLNDAVGMDQPAQGTDGATLAEVISIHGPDPADQIADREDAEETLATIAGGLSVLEREALLGVVFHDLSYREAAFMLGTSTRSLDNAIQRARRKLADPELRARAVERLETRRPETTLKRTTVYIDRRHYPRERQAIAAAFELRPGRIVEARKRKLLDGQDRAPQGRATKDGRLGTPVWRIVVEYLEAVAA